MPAKTKPHSVSARPRSTKSDQSKSQPNLARHGRKCAICNHPYREQVEDDFISWRSEEVICHEFFITSRSAIYRHAVATGLLQCRRRNLRGVAERILEHVDDAPPSASAVLRALRIFSQITEDGQWIEPPKRSIVTHIHVTQHPSAESHSACPETCPPGREPAVQVARASEQRPAPNSAETVAAGLSRQHSVSVSAESVGISPTSPSHDQPPNCHSEPARRGGRVPTSLVGATRNLHFDPSASPIERDVQSHTPVTPSAPAVTVEASSCVSSTAAPDDDYYARLQYIPHWARGIVPERPRATTLKKEPVSAETRPNVNEQNTLPHAPAQEILIGHQNASPKTSTSRKSSP